MTTTTTTTTDDMLPHGGDKVCCGAILATRGSDGNVRYCDCPVNCVHFMEKTPCCRRHMYVYEPTKIIGECSICLSECLSTDSRTTSCKHTFHKKCIGKWLNTNPTCPLCRAVIGKIKVTPKPVIVGNDISSGPTAETLGERYRITMDRFLELQRRFEMGEEFSGYSQEMMAEIQQLLRSERIQELILSVAAQLPT